MVKFSVDVGKQAGRQAVLPLFTLLKLRWNGKFVQGYIVVDGLYGHGCGWHDIDIEWYSPYIIYKRDLVYTIVDMIARHTLNHDVTLFLGSVVSVPMGPMFVLRTIFCIFLFRTCYSESREKIFFFYPLHSI